jgi:hypothetical protein
LEGRFENARVGSGRYVAVFAGSDGTVVNAVLYGELKSGVSFPVGWYSSMASLGDIVVGADSMFGDTSYLRS